MREPPLTGPALTGPSSSTDHHCASGRSGTGRRWSAVALALTTASRRAESANALQDMVVPVRRTPYNSVSSPRDSPNHRRPGFRIAVHAVDRAPVAGTVGV